MNNLKSVAVANNLKSVAVAVAMTFVATAANAGIYADNSNFGVQGNAGSAPDSGGIGELFVSIVARDAANPANNNSYTRDLGGFALASDFVDSLRAGTLSNLNFTVSPDARLSDFLTANAGFDISYNLAAIHNSEVITPDFASIDVGALTTSTDPLGAGDGPQGFTPMNNLYSNVQNFTLTNNNLADEQNGRPNGTRDPADHFSNTCTSSDNCFHDFGNWGNNNAQTFGFATEGLLGGDPLEFYLISGTDDLATQGFTSKTPELVGAFNLATDGTLSFAGAGGASPVPVPAAVWLFASGLMGLVGVARRRKV